MPDRQGVVHRAAPASLLAGMVQIMEQTDATGFTEVMTSKASLSALCYQPNVSLHAVCAGHAALQGE